MLTRRTLSLSLVALSGVSLAVLRLFLFVFRYDNALAHYAGGWEEPTVLLLSVATIALFAILSRTHKQYGKKNVLASLPRIGLAPAIACLAFGVALLASLHTAIEIAYALLMAAALSLLAAAVSLVVLAIPTKESLELYLFPTLAPVLYAVYRYFDLGLPMNSPAKLFEMLAAMAIALAFLAKCRSVAAKPMPRYSYTVTATAAVFGFAEGLPRLVTAVIGGDAVSVLAALLFLVFSIYFACALYSGIGEYDTDEEKTDDITKQKLETHA